MRNIDKIIIQIYNNENIKFFSKNINYIILKSCWYIYQIKK